MNTSLGRSLWKGARNALIVAAGAVAAAFLSPEVADGFKDAGPIGQGILLIAGALVSAGADYVKRKLPEKLNPDSQ